ncbi:GUN4 domain-containing protein [Nostoc commune NIES-4072]|uniref:GUN4 domain-containing protein n=1 Tax=Nostoc commune NIES-4072 TaxID=2005467 RepID=A0A2R5FKB1_NOSCO|nr:GUN4 domain-containing protein [Nostoc commune]BBD63954.1 GUN4 domain-containing protein [Nostoc commune HK-02]GBG18725.1 GUN4 domain-containing protein [Nostoc commune NIES-4072]
MNQQQFEFDVFLAHNSQDKPKVKIIANKLKQRGLKPWLDEEQMYGGDTPYREIQTALYKSKSVVFFLGLSGSGKWQGNLELPITVDLVIQSNLRLIPVLLPGVKEIPPLPDYGFLRTKLWINFETIDDINAQENLYKSIRRNVKNEIKQVETDNLDSEKGINYTRLRDLLAEAAKNDLLAAKNWEEADKETYRVMIQAVGKEEGDYFTSYELLNFPCTDLRTIDHLWVRHSNKHFGFSVQKEIYLSVGGKADGKYDEKAWEKFGDRVGWRGEIIGFKKGISYTEVTFNISSPRGHLPSAGGSMGLFCLKGWLGGWVTVWSLFSHRDLLAVDISYRTGDI